MNAQRTPRPVDEGDLSWQQLVVQACGGLLVFGLRDHMALVTSLVARERRCHVGCDEMLLRALRDAALTGEWAPDERRDRVQRILAGYVADIAATRTH